MLSARLRQADTHKHVPLISEESTERIVQTLGNLKGVALKLGQTFALSQSSQPEAAKALLHQMFSQAPPLEYQVIQTLLENEFKKPPDKIFKHFETVPFAAASLGQVHKGTLHDGRQVAVKVQYPNANHALWHDLNNLAVVLRTAGLGLNLFNEKEYIEELQQQFSDELDYSLELKRLEQFRALLKPWPDLHVPYAYPDLCTPRVLTTELLNGRMLTEVCTQNDQHTPDERFRIANQLIQAIYGPFLQEGTIHGDCHPGNFIIMTDGRLGMLDFGCTRTFSPSFWKAYRRTVRATLDGELEKILELTRQAGFHIQLEDDAARSLLHELSNIVSRPMMAPYDFGTCRIRENVTALVRRRPQDFLRVRPPSEGIFFFRSIVGLTDILRMLKSHGDFRPTFSALLTSTEEQQD